MEIIKCEKISQPKIGIYKITSPSGRVYIGQSWNIDRRIMDYKYSHGIKSQRLLYNSVSKYGWENHKFEIIHELPNDISQDILNNYEVLYWDIYKDCNFKMLNIKEPGSKGKHSEETKLRMKERRKNQVFSDKTKSKMSNSAKKKDLSIAINNISKFQLKGSKNPRATITEDIVKLIKDDLRKELKYNIISNKYNVNKNIIGNIKLGKSWTHIN